MALIEIERPSAEQTSKLEESRSEFDAMMETIHPYLKRKTKIRRISKSEWRSCD